MENKIEKKNTVIKHKRRLLGVVVSDKMKNTVVVETNRLVKHPKYQKYFRVTKRYKADDPGNTKKIGAQVEIEECRPISKDKHFKIIQ
ncbi:MAG: small subunit ribosomal protein S17 [Parcubacteria group bacterium Gr01-1014_73]|nr:MAG: small subunit ribosomal protein S17 [Parcubacteria group bacterium Gr01-1014_73]